MIHDCVIDLQSDKAPVELYFDDNGWPILDHQPDIVHLAEFECPQCHNHTYGRFEPFVHKGVRKWCSSCFYTEVDKATFKQYYTEHPDEVVKLDE